MVADKEVVEAVSVSYDLSSLIGGPFRSLISTINLFPATRVAKNSTNKEEHTHTHTHKVESEKKITNDPIKRERKRINLKKKNKTKKLDGESADSIADGRRSPFSLQKKINK